MLQNLIRLIIPAVLVTVTLSCRSPEKQQDKHTSNSQTSLPATGESNHYCGINEPLVEMSEELLSFLGNNWRLIDDLTTKKEYTIEGKGDFSIDGFSISNGQYLARKFIYRRKIGRTPYKRIDTQNASFKFTRILQSKAATTGKYEGYYLVILEGVSEYYEDLKCIITSMKMSSKDGETRLEMRGWSPRNSQIIDSLVESESIYTAQEFVDQSQNRIYEVESVD